MRGIMKAVRTTLTGLAMCAGALSASVCSADTVLSVTDTTYDAALRPVCTALRMNPGPLGGAPALTATIQPAGNVDTTTPVGACARLDGGSNAYGPDRITRTEYNEAGQVTVVHRAFGTDLAYLYARYSYTPNGLKATETDANGNMTALVYDSFDRLSQVQYPSTSVGSGAINPADFELFGYDDNGNRTSWRRRNNKTITYSYDNLNRETVRTVSDNSIQPVHSGYDIAGRLVYARYGSDSGAGISNSYDDLGRLSSTTDMNNRSVLYGYNAAGLRTGLQFPDGAVQIYAYGRATSDLTWTGVNGQPVAISFAYNELGRLSGAGRTNSVNTHIDYDDLGRMTSYGHGLPDTAHNIGWTFGYNPASQIVSLGADNDLYDYTENGSGVEARSFDGLNRDATIVAMSGGYDANGNLANDGQRQMTYDVFNRLIAVTGGGASLTLTYDPIGRLSGYVSSGTATQFLYDGTNLIGEYDGSGNLLRRYLHTLGVDQPFVELSGSGFASPKYLLGNYQGSIVALADGSGSVSASDVYKYGPFGEPRNSGNQESWTGSRFRYTGQTVIPEARLYYYKARVYDPVYGRFLQTDPIGTKDDLDLYAYVGADPINKTDPTGNDANDPSILNDMEADRETTLCSGSSDEGGCVHAVNKQASDLQGKMGLVGLGAFAGLACAEGCPAAAGAIRFAYRLNQVRKILDGWKEEPNTKNSGRKFTDPTNPKGNRVRVDPADPESPYKHQQQDHVVEQKDGKTVDSNGDPIPPENKPSRTPEAHQPLSEWLKRMMGNR